MITGLDTGYFLRLLEGNEEAVSVWKSIMEGDRQAVVCALTFFELKRLSLQGRIKKDATQKLIEAIEVLCRIVWLDNMDLLIQSASLSHGTGIPTVDSIIVMSLVSLRAADIYTTDSHLQAYKNKAVKIIKI
jgi:PIN domain nuclease of toxin-antitoxin system